MNKISFEPHIYVEYKNLVLKMLLLPLLQQHDLTSLHDKSLKK